MRVAILAGGRGTRLQEETTYRPKPMVEIGGKPILWHIMKHFAHYGHRDFYIALGYLGHQIKDYFLSHFELSGNLTVDFSTRSVHRENEQFENWRVHLIETGDNTGTGGRIRRLRNWLRDDTMIVTYGDGVADVDLTALIEFHRAHGRLATVTAVRPPARFGGLILDGDTVTDFTEKPVAHEGWINGGYLVFEPEVLNYVDADDSSLEVHALERLAEDGQLRAYRHDQFWQCMDTLREKIYLESLWNADRAPWRVWDDHPAARRAA